MSEWRTGGPRELIGELRAGGWVQGQTGLLPQLVRLHKTDITADLRRLPATHVLTWRIAGDPEATGRHASKRRTIIIWLGGK